MCGSVCAGGQCWTGHNKTALQTPEMFIRVIGAVFCGDPDFVRVADGLPDRRSDVGFVGFVRWLLILT